MLAVLPEGVTTRVIFMRHGEPDESVRGRCYGSLDVGLSEPGRAQVREVATWLAAARVDEVVASPSRRARESAELLVDARQDLPMRFDARLQEIDFGAFEGLAFDEIAARYPDEYRAWMERPTEVRFPGGESFAELRARVRDALAELRRPTVPRVVLLVGHGGGGRVLVGDALGLEDHAVFRVEQSYGAITVVDWYGETPLVRLVNRT